MNEELKKAMNTFIDELFERDEVVAEVVSDKDSVKKSADCDEDKVEKADDKEEDKEDGLEEKDEAFKAGFRHALKTMKKKMSAKKSLKAASDEEELDSSKENEKMEKSLVNENSDLKKSLASLTEQISTLQGAVEKMAKSPMARKSVRGVDVIKKSVSEGEATDIDNSTATAVDESFLKSQAGRARIAEIMAEDGVVAGKLTARQVAEFEASGSIADVQAQRVVKALVRDRMEKGLF